MEVVIVICMNIFRMEVHTNEVIQIMVVAVPLLIAILQITVKQVHLHQKLQQVLTKIKQEIQIRIAHTMKDMKMFMMAMIMTGIDIGKMMIMQMA